MNLIQWLDNLLLLAKPSRRVRSWSAIARFYDNCKKKVKGKKGFPKFKKHCRSVEYKTTGFKLNRANRQKSKKFSRERKKAIARQSNNYHKARNRYARKHLRVSRQRKEYCLKLAYSVIQSNDLVAYEDLNVKGLVRNRHLAKSISDAGWYTFRLWLEYFGHKYGKVTVAVPPHNTSQNCSNCGEKVKKSLSTRTHVCPKCATGSIPVDTFAHCGYVADRDLNASVNILKIGLSTVGHTGIYATGDLPSWAVGASLSSNGESVNVESPRL